MYKAIDVKKLFSNNEEKVIVEFYNQLDLNIKTDCRKIKVSKQLLEDMIAHSMANLNSSDKIAIGMAWVMKGPSVAEYLPYDVAVVEEE